MRLRTTLAALGLIAAVGVAACTPGPAPDTVASPPASVGATGESPRTDSFAELAQKVQARIARHWPHLGAKVWPGLDYSSHSLVLFKPAADGTVDEAWLATPSALRRLAPHEYRSLTVPERGSYVALTFEGRPSVAITHDPELVPDLGDGSIVYRIATHELVHFYYQGDMTVTDPGDPDRVEPPGSKARLYRAMLYRNLLRALDEPAAMDEALAHAAHWNTKWKAEFPHDSSLMADGDIAEGTARYLEMQGMFAGDGLSGEDRERAHLKEIPRDLAFEAPMLEGYELGHAAGLLLDRLSPSWKDGFFVRGQTPVDELLAGVTPKEQAVDPDVEAAVAEQSRG